LKKFFWGRIFWGFINGKVNSRKYKGHLKNLKLNFPSREKKKHTTIVLEYIKNIENVILILNGDNFINIEFN
jgi:F420-0:gamma-glutamyl ligase-like protein